jgi:outer membrane protein OmpA-like peptidoglycan-associated protein
MTAGDDRAASAAGGALGELVPGTVIGGYQIDGVAGRGGMGIVYRATQLSLGRTVALKVIDPHLAADPGFRRRFEDESALAASLDHPSVVTIHEAGEDQGRLYVSMRLVPGTDLGKLLAAEGPLEAGRAVALIAGVADALDAAHAAGLVHRDVKPSNVLVERRPGGERAFLSDFGVVKRIGADAEKTGSAGWVGSADFVAPEQVLGGAVDGRSDIYALGGVLYTALTSRVPFDRPDIAGKLYASVNEPVPSVRRVRPELPAGLDEVIARATAKDPGARYATAAEFAAAAQAAAAQAPPATAPSAPATPPLATPPPATPASAASAPAGSRPAATRRATDGIGSRRWRGGAALGAAAVALAALIVVLGALIVVVGAAGSGGAKHKPPAGATRRASVRSRTPAKTPASSSAPRALPAGLRTIEFSPDGSEEIGITIYDLRRTGPFVTLDFKAACLAGSGCEQGTGFAFNFYEGEGTFGSNSLGGIRLLDPINDKVYRPVQDAGQNVWQSTLDISLVSSPSQLLWVKFPAPPPSVTHLDVLFSNGGPQVSAMPITTASVGPSRSEVGPGVEIPGPATFAEPPDSTNASGLVMPINTLRLTVGNAAGAEAESGNSTTVTLNTDILFKFGKSTLTAAATATLQHVGADIAKRATGTVIVDGYTDSIGTVPFNLTLSQARAQAVVAALKPFASSVSYTAHGYGEADPVAPNTKPNGSDNPAGRALNRRVTISYDVKVAAAPTPPAATTSSANPAGATGTVVYNALSGSAYQIRVDDLYREGNLVVAHYSAKCLASYGNGCNFKTDFAAESSSQRSADGPPIPASQNDIPGFNTPYATSDAVYLEDAAGTIYDPAQDDANLTSSPAVANTDSLGSSEGPKPFESLWAYFPAPPANVTTMSLVLPGGKARISGVAVEPSAAG